MTKERKTIWVEPTEHPVPIPNTRPVQFIEKAVEAPEAILSMPYWQERLRSNELRVIPKPADKPPKKQPRKKGDSK